MLTTIDRQFGMTDDDTSAIVEDAPAPEGVNAIDLHFSPPSASTLARQREALEANEQRAEKAQAALRR